MVKQKIIGIIMKRESIIINSIDKDYQRIPYVGEYGARRLKSLEVEFEYKNISSTIKISTNEPLSEEEIKDKIIEVLE